MLKFQNKLKKFSNLVMAVIVFTLINLACKATANLISPTTPTVNSPTEILSPIPLSPSFTPFPTATYLPTVSPTPPPTPTQATDILGCEGILAIRLLDLPEQSKDLFEYHAKGTFLILHLEVLNLTQNPIQILSDDYTLILPHENNEILLKPHKAATNYLYLVRGDSFYQDQIKPTSIWRTYLAFDIPPETTNWSLLLAPQVRGIHNRFAKQPSFLELIYCFHPYDERSLPDHRLHV